MKQDIQLIGEIGINHNGSLRNALDMIDIAKAMNFDMVKFQKRNPETCVPPNQRNKEKFVPWRDTSITYLQYKKDIEFNYEYATIAQHCRDLGIGWFVSVWDLDSAEYMLQYGNRLVKIPSALLTNHKLLSYCRDNYETVMLSTGMSTQQEIDKAVAIGRPDILMHTNSNYPTIVEDTNLGYLLYLKQRYPNCSIGYSNHCTERAVLFAAASYPIDYLEIHVTLDTTRWGSDQQASFEISGLQSTLHDLRVLCDNKGIWEKGNEPRTLYKGEEEKQQSLRGSI